MKKIFGLALASIAVLTSCKKAFEQPGDLSSFAVIHASPVATTAPTDTLHVFVGADRYTNAGATYLTTTTYLPIASGTHQINIRRKSDVSSALYVNTFTETMARGDIFSYFVYDTTTSATGQARVLRLKDNLTLPAVTNSHVRALHLAPNAPAVDITLVRTSVTPRDSVTLTNRTYIGATPNANALAAFTPVPRGVYDARIKLAGTQTVVLAVAVDMSRGTDVGQGGIFTIYACGTAKGQPLAIRSIRHF
jgi:hypothetical protein